MNIETLCQQALEDPDWFLRRKAIRELRNHNTPEVVKTLLQVLDLEIDGDVVQAAILVLLKHGAGEMLEFIIKPKIMMSPEEPVRWACAHALGRIGSTRNFEHLYKFVHDKEWSVRTETINTLKLLINKLGEREGDDFQETEDLFLLIRMLQIDNLSLQETIIKQLLSFDPALAEYHLLSGLETENEFIKVGLIKTLGGFRSKNAVAQLILLLSSPSVQVRLAVVEALGEIGGLPAINGLIQQLSDPNDTLIKASIKGILRHRDDELLHLSLKEYLRKDTNIHRKKNILFIMGEIRSPSFISPILRNLGSSYFRIRKTATEALIKFGEEIREAVVQTLEINKVPLEHLIEEANSGATLSVRVNAIKALGDIKHPEAISAISELAQSERAEISRAAEDAYRQISEGIWARANAALVLGELGSESGIEPLEKVTGDESFRVRWAAVNALAQIRSVRSVEILCRIAQTERYKEIRQDAVSALGSIGHFSEEVKIVLFEKILDISHWVRLEAARALGKVDDPRAIDALLVTLCDNSFKVRRNALNALYTMGREVIPKVEKLFAETNNIYGKLNILDLFGMFFYKEAIPQIESILQNEVDESVITRGKQILSILRGKPGDNKVLFFS